MAIKVYKPSNGEKSSTESFQISEKDQLAGYSPLTQLPSKFIPYHEKTVYARPFNLGEIEDLNSTRNFDIRVFVDTIRDVVKGINVEDLTVIDLKTVLLYALILSADNSMWNMPVVCEECGTQYVKSLGISDIHFQDLEVDGLPLVSDVSGLEDITFDVFRIRHLLEMDDFTKRNTDVKITSLTRAVLSDIRPIDKAYKFFREASPKLLKTLKELEDLLIHGIDPVMCKCTNQVKGIRFLSGEDQDKILNQFKSLKPIRDYGVSVPPNDKELISSIKEFINQNEMKFQLIGCSHVQETEVELNLGSFFPESFY